MHLLLFLFLNLLLRGLSLLLYTNWTGAPMVCLLCITSGQISWPSTMIIDRSVLSHQYFAATFYRGRFHSAFLRRVSPSCSGVSSISLSATYKYPFFNTILPFLQTNMTRSMSSRAGALTSVHRNRQGLAHDGIWSIAVFLALQIRHEYFRGRKVEEPVKLIIFVGLIGIGWLFHESFGAAKIRQSFLEPMSSFSSTAAEHSCGGAYAWYFDVASMLHDFLYKV